MILEGALSVKSALENKRRDIIKVYIQDKKHSKDLNYILYLCHQYHYQFEFVSSECINQLANGNTHGGVLLQCESRKYESIERCCQFGLLLEGIEDPYNLGNCIRSAYCAGVDTVYLMKRDYTAMESILMKSSAGTFDRINIVLLDDVSHDLQYLKNDGIRLVSALRNEQSHSYLQADLSDRLILCIGGEKRGLSKTVIELSDDFVEIEYLFDAKIALSAVSSCAVLLFESVAQRRRKS